MPTDALFLFVQVPRTSSASRRLHQRCRRKVAVHASTVVPQIHLYGGATQTATLSATLVVSHHLSLIRTPCPLYALSLFLSRLGRATRERSCRHVALTRGDIWCLWSLLACHYLSCVCPPSVRRGPSRIKHRDACEDRGVQPHVIGLADCPQTLS
jgi:hypothetical protein